MEKKKKYKTVAAADAKYRGAHLLWAGIVFAASCFGVFMMVFSIMRGSYVFALSYLIAVILGFSFVLIKWNTVSTTSLASDGQMLYLKNWDNDFLPYQIHSKVRWIGEFIPARVQMTEIPIEEIQLILIGTKNYVKRYCENPEFNQAVAPFEKSRDYYKKRSVQTMDLIYLGLTAGEYAFMPIQGFSPEAVRKVLQTVRKVNPEADIRVSSRRFRQSGR